MKDAWTSTLPKSQWLSYTRPFSIVQPYSPARVWRQVGPGQSFDWKAPKFLS